MSDQNNQSSSNQNQNQNGSGETLYAGKYKTVAELEEGYKQSLPVHQENQNLKKKLEDVTKVPDEYQTPTDITLHEADLALVKKEAKNSGLTQAQYEKLARERNALSASKHQSYEEAKKALGADKLNLLQDFLKKTYPEKVAETLLKQAIVNKDIQDQIFAQREAALNSQVPGSGRVSTGGGYHVTDKDVLKAREEMNSMRGKARVEAQRRYINLNRELAHQKQASKNAS